MESQRLDYDEARTESLAVKSTAKSLVEMGICGEDMSLQMASEYLDELVTEDPETRNLLIEASNLWAEIENMTSESTLLLLTSFSQDISKNPEGKKLIRSLPLLISDKGATIDTVKEYFANEVVLNTVLNSKPGLSEKWYDHLYVTFKMAVKVVEEERDQ